MSAIIGKLQTPADDNGVRKDIHLITEATAVIIDSDTTLADWCQDHTTGPVVISTSKPSQPGIWIEPVR